MNPFSYIRERITDIANNLAAVDGRDPTWDYATLTQLIDNIEKDYNAKYGSSDTVSRQAAIDAVIKRDANCGIDSAEVLKTLPSAQPEIIRCKNCEKYKTMFCAIDIWTEDVTIYTAKPDDFCSRAERREG